MLKRLLRSVLVGLVAGLVLIAVVERTPEGVDLPAAIGGMVLLVVAMGLGRWWLGRRKDRKKDEEESQ